MQKYNCYKTYDWNDQIHYTKFTADLSLTIDAKTKKKKNSRQVCKSISFPLLFMKNKIDFSFVMMSTIELHHISCWYSVRIRKYKNMISNGIPWERENEDTILW